MTADEVKILEKAYQAASFGTETPELVFGKCGVCGRGFTLVKGRDNSDVPCEHMRNILNASVRGEK